MIVPTLHTASGNPNFISRNLNSPICISTYIYPLQSGDHPRHKLFSFTALTNSIRSFTSRSIYIGVVFLDFSKVFNTVTHKFLLPKRANLGYPPLTSPIAPKLLVFLASTHPRLSFFWGLRGLYPWSHSFLCLHQ